MVIGEVTVLSFSFPRLLSGKLRDQRRGAEMMRESMPVNNGRNATEEFDRADAGKQMKGNSTVH